MGDFVDANDLSGLRAIDSSDVAALAIETEQILNLIDQPESLFCEGPKIYGGGGGEVEGECRRHRLMLEPLQAV